MYQKKLALYLSKHLQFASIIQFQYFFTGKSFSEGFILESVNPQYDDRLFIDLQLLTQENTNSEHVVYKNCFECQNKNNFCTQHVLNLYFSG